VYGDGVWCNVYIDVVSRIACMRYAGHTTKTLYFGCVYFYFYLCVDGYLWPVTCNLYPVPVVYVCVTFRRVRVGVIYYYYVINCYIQ